MAKDHIVLLGCGDVGPKHEPMGPYSELVRPTLAKADIRFAQVERVYTDKGELQPSGGHHSRAKPDMSSVITDCGFDVVSLASNHAMDWGPAAMLDSRDLLQKKGLKTIGAGATLLEARQPAFIEKDGVKVAFLGYSSIVREGYAATAKSAGVAPMRVHTAYENIDYQAGAAPRVLTVPYEQDLANLLEDVAAAKKVAHVVILSLHWGIHYTPRVLADYQPVVAKAALAAGADLIFGHHPHVPKAIGVHGGKVCFYSLSNLIMSRPEKTEAQAKTFAKRHGIPLDPDYPRLPYGLDSKRSLIAKVLLTREGIKKVSFLPLFVDKQLRPEVLHNGDPRFDDAVKYMDWASEDFDHKFVVEGDEIVVTGN